MKADKHTEKQGAPRKETMETFRALVLLVLIAAFIGTQFYFLFTTILAS